MSNPDLTDGPNGAPRRKPLSCIVCRQRKVRCDKQYPCSNCRLGGIACTIPSNDRPPRWARRYTATTTTAFTTSADAHKSNADQKKSSDRLQFLESAVKELTDELDKLKSQADPYGQSGRSPKPSLSNKSSTYPYADAYTASTLPEPDKIQDQLGKLVLEDPGRSRYVSSSFWSRVDDELQGLESNTDKLRQQHAESLSRTISPDQSAANHPCSPDLPSDCAFLFPNRVDDSYHDRRELFPSPSQAEFLLNAFSENINFAVQLVHLPTFTHMLGQIHESGSELLSVSNEALVFSVLYAAVVSLEEEDVEAQFGISKVELDHRYRRSFELALAKANFLTAPDLILVQATAIFLFLARRHENPTFVWMMTGLAIRMARYLGLHKDGSQFKSLTPFQIEMRRRVWWALYLLDLRVSDDLGTDTTIANESFDTKMPLNINDADICSKTIETPQEHEGLTDVSFLRVFIALTDIQRQLMASQDEKRTNCVEDKGQLVTKIYQKFEDGYLKYMTDPGNVKLCVGVKIARLTMAKMTLISLLPVLFSPSGQGVSEELQAKLLISAIEVAEYNHELNSEQAFRQWRWIYQTYTHWHAIIYILIAITRRSWSAISERAWIVLQSPWLFPPRVSVDRNLRLWLPLQKLLGNARAHRDTELVRLRADPQAVIKLDFEDQTHPTPSSSGSLPAGSATDVLRMHWRNLVSNTKESDFLVNEDLDYNPSTNASELQGDFASVHNDAYSLTQTDIDSNLSTTPTSNKPYFPVIDSTDNSKTAFEIMFDETTQDDWSFAEFESMYGTCLGPQTQEGDASMEWDSTVDWNRWLEFAKTSGYEF